ncbi:MAG: polysaccharide biosynthesis protein [Parcubacteria group bacterium Gr01-1014_46]|nr:MAG: polysaccharide biosynthesis protein [Parcubacteria group bacterium Gr01-1014_46]
MDYFRDRTVGGLKWLETYAKTDMVYLASGGFWTIFSQVVISFGTFLLAISFAHFVSKEAYGEYKYILSISSILGTLTLTGLGNAVLKSVVQGNEGTLQYAFWTNMKWSVFSFLLALGLSAYYFLNDNQSLGIALIIIGAFSPLWSSTNLYDAYLAAKKDFRRSAIYFGIIGNFFPLICIFITLLLTDNTLWLVFVYFASNTLIGIILYLRIFKIYKPNDKVDKGIVSYSKHLSIIKILSGLANNIDQILIFHFIGPIQLALYNFALAMPSQIKGPVKGIATIALPKFTERDDLEIRTGMKNKYIVVFVLSIIMIAVYILIAPYVFKIFFPKYLESIFYSQILSLSLLSIISIPVETYFVAKEKIKEQYIANITVPILQMIIMFVFILWKGLIGIVIAKVITKILWSIINIALFQKFPNKNNPVSVA